jgi:hypothetical protein
LFTDSPADAPSLEAGFGAACFRWTALLGVLAIAVVGALSLAASFDLEAEMILLGETANWASRRSFLPVT